MHNTHRQITLIGRIYHDSNCNYIKNFFKFFSPINHFFIDRCMGFWSTIYFDFYIMLAQFIFNRPRKFPDISGPFLVRGFQLNINFFKHLRIQRTENQIIQLPFDRCHTQPMREGRIYITCFNRDPMLFHIGKIPNCLHVM